MEVQTPDSRCSPFSFVVTHDFSCGLAFIGPIIILVGLSIWLTFRFCFPPAKQPMWARELSQLGTSRSPSQKRSGTAVVCGGSIAGLLTARICADHFSKVYLVDPEMSIEPKKRILQYDSLHGYLTFMLDGLRRLWPEFDVELKKAGGIACDGDFKLHYGGLHIATPYDNDSPLPVSRLSLPQMFILRRSRLQSLLQRLLLKNCPDIQVVDGTVRTVVPSLDKGQIHSITVRASDGNNLILDDISLVVDCTGTAQAGLKWLKAAGYSLPKSLRLMYDPKMHYTTVTFSVSSELKRILTLPAGMQYEEADWLYTFYADSKYGNTGFVLTKMDSDTIQMCCGGWGDITLPRNPSEIETYVRGVKGREDVPDWVVNTVRRLSEDGKPVFKLVRIPPCSYIRYHRLCHLPSNFVAIGDSTMQLDPIFAQGCSKALLEVMTLNCFLTSCTDKSELPKKFASGFFKSTAHRTENLWDATKAIDYGFNSTQPVDGEKLSNGCLTRWYIDKLMLMAHRDPEAAYAVWKVRMFIAPQTILFSLHILRGMVYAACATYLRTWFTLGLRNNL